MTGLPASDVTALPPDPTRRRSRISPVTSREELIYLLSRACELEHGLACIYLFAAHSLKSDVREGGIDESQIQMVRRWRGRLARVAVEEMLHLAQVSNLLTAIGGAPNFRRTNFPMPASAYPFGVCLTLEPFSTLTIERFVTYELPEPGILSSEDQETCDAVRARVLEAQGESGGGLIDAEAVDGLEPFEIDFSTVGEFYHKIETGFWNIPEEDLFIGPAEAQANGRYVDLGDELIAVVGRDSACAAIDMIVEQGEAPSVAHPDAHYAIFDGIRREYAQANARSAATGIPFEPVRAVTPNPMTRFYDDTSGGNIIAEPATHLVADLYNVAYDTMLLMLLRFFSHTDEIDAELEHLSRATLRLMTSVLRPLGDALTRMPIDAAGSPGMTAGPGFGYNRDVHLLSHKTSAWTFFGERLWELATASTGLCSTAGLPTEVQEAAAALQDLACQFAPPDGPKSASAKVAELASLQAGIAPGIVASFNGPYLVSNADSVENWLGERIPARPQMALCRCGGSSIKPFCDGTHARIGFSGTKAADRVADHRDAYPGPEITVFDNRGICAHSGLCTDALASAFRIRGVPFVDPDGAPTEDIIRAVNACPSGALGYAVGGVEASQRLRPPCITVSRDGPYRVTGGIPLTDEEGRPQDPHAAAQPEHYSLCRCGQSQNKPFCSGKHWYVNFHDPNLPADRDPTLFEWAGGLPALSRMTRLFYDRHVLPDPELGPLFAEMAPDQPERMAAWLGMVLGGPEAAGPGSAGKDFLIPELIPESVTGLSETQRVRWVGLLTTSADETGLPTDAEFRSAFLAYLEGASRVVMQALQPDAPAEDVSVRRARWTHWNWSPAGPPLRAAATPVDPSP